MLNIVCFKWGTKFTSKYVNRLYRSIERNVTVPHNFVCFTEDPEGVECETQPFLQDLPTWWYIIGLFNPDHGFKDKVLYMDLDTVITDNIDHIVSWDTDFAITEDFYRPKGLQTTFIMWRPQWGYFVYDEFLKLVPPNPGSHFMKGTNGFIEAVTKRSKVDIFQDEFPEEFISYKVHVRDVKQHKSNSLPGNLNTAKVVCYHGNPMPHTLENLDWMKKHWI